MISYPAAAVRAHASCASASDQPPVHTRACTPRGDDALTGDDAPDEVAADEVAADEVAPPRAWALVGTDARWTAVDVARWTGSRPRGTSRRSLSRRVPRIRGVAMDAEGRANGADVIDETSETGRARSARGERCQCRTGDVMTGR